MGWRSTSVRCDMILFNIWICSMFSDQLNFLHTGAGKFQNNEVVVDSAKVQLLY